MPAAQFAHIRTWVFDLDNTLYSPSVDLFGQIRPRMTRWLMRHFGIDTAEANLLREDYWIRYGTTLAGLVSEHGIDPQEFLAEAHDIDFSGLTSDPKLADAIAALPGRRVVFTNGNSDYADRVLAARGLNGVFDTVYGAEHAGFVSKPVAEAFARIFALEGLTPHESAMFEDDPRNLTVPRRLGLRTVLVAEADVSGDDIDVRTDDLTGFLGQLVTARAAGAGV